MVFYKKIIRTMTENKSRYLASILLIILSTGLYTAFSMSGPEAFKTLEDFRKTYKVEDALFITGKEISDIKELESTYNLKLEKRKVFDTEVFQDSTLRVLEKTTTLNKYQVTEGEDLKADKDILVNKDFAEKNNKKIGDLINIKGIDFKLKGFFAEPDYTYVLKNETDIVPNPQKFGISVISQNDMNSLEWYSYSYSVSFGESDETSFKEYLDKNYQVLKWLNQEDNPRVSAIDGDMGGFFELGKTIPIVILVITSLLIAIVQWRIIKNEFNQIGTLYAIGYSKVKILVHYLSYSVIIVLIGGVLGQIPGIYLGKPLIATQAVQYNLPIIDLQIKPEVMLISLMLPFIIIIPVCIFVIMKALKLSAVELMKGVLKEGKPNFLERKLNLKKLNFDTRFKIREILRNIPRTILMLLSVLFASALILFGFVTNDSINWVFNNSYEQTYRYEYFYTFNTLQYDKSIDGEKLWIQSSSVKDKSGKILNIKLQGMEEDEKLINLINKKGDKLSINKNIITVPLAKKLHIKVGDIVTVKSKIDEKEIKVTIDEIADNYIGDFIFIPIKDFYEKLDKPKDSYVSFISENPHNFDKTIIMVEMKKSDIVSGFKDLTKPLKGLLIFISILATLIGLILIYIITSLIIEENRLNISLLKIIGYQNKKIYSLILNTNTVVVILGFILSVPFILVVVDSLYQKVTSKMDFSIPAKLEYHNIAIAFIMLMVTYELAKFLTRRKVISIPMVEALKAGRE